MSDGRFKKGLVPWNKNKKGLQVNPLKGKKMPDEWKVKLRKPKSFTPPKSQETKDKIRASLKLKVGNLNSNWKGGKLFRKKGSRRARILKNGGSHTFGEWELLKKQYGYKCVSCFKEEPIIKLTEDHIIPLSKGGTHNIENIQPLCMKCNLHKFTKIIKYV